MCVYQSKILCADLNVASIRAGMRDTYKNSDVESSMKYWSCLDQVDNKNKALY